MYVWIRSERTLWTVGHYDPDGRWVSESDHDSPEKAVGRVHWLHGGKDLDLLAALKLCEDRLSRSSSPADWPALEAARAAIARVESQP